ncbi:MAG: hypothetical protein IH851_13275, partial [Armatimonadetes bacterium]|nr:hypothetical protein [Armatimonadota bacterium]
QGSFPIPWEQTELTPNIGVIDSTADIRRGLGYDGLMHLMDFVESGGLLLTMSDSANFVIDSGITRYVSSSQAPSDLQARGAIFNSRITDPTSPIAYGFDEDNAVYFSGRMLLQVSVGGGGFRGGFGGGRDGAARTSGRRGEDFIPGRPPVAEEEEEEVRDERYTDVDNLLREDDPRARAGQPSRDVFPRIIMRFASSADDLLLSGMIDDGSSLADRPAIIDAPVGEGHVVMYAINPMWRMQTHGSYMLLFNAAVNFQNMSPEEEPIDDRR